ncbi:uncharacterized protein DSM5745_00332 [Aspergillus mulundensis]|uniref:Uncharacterized protein n=1 Tax=Aspergillus mulundensis TaxID=1810919 RepID=A0A3D8T398_9EURO|nr:hypothetical protein DSM5745_00332 [Aspergillus mulundensis]RDW93010.1 hypothetical protein DSM5745_00332 [Aspergillus mulundensis]
MGTWNTAPDGNAPPITIGSVPSDDSDKEWFFNNIQMCAERVDESQKAIRERYQPAEGEEAPSDLTIRALAHRLQAYTLACHAFVTAEDASRIDYKAVSPMMTDASSGALSDFAKEVPPATLGDAAIIIKRLIEHDLARKKDGEDDIDLFRKAYAGVVGVATPENLQDYVDKLKGGLCEDRNAKHALKALVEEGKMTKTVADKIRESIEGPAIAVFVELYGTIDIATVGDASVIESEIAILQTLDDDLSLGSWFLSVVPEHWRLLVSVTGAD